MEQVNPPATRRTAATLTAPEIVLIWATQLVWMSLVQVFLHRGGFYLWFYGPDAQAGGSPHDPLARFRQMLWVTAIATPLQVVTALILLRHTMEIPLEEVGVTTRHLSRNLVMGLLFTVIFVPGTQGINWLANTILKSAGSLGQDHPLTQLGRAPIEPIEWGLLIFGAVVAVPVWEELVFRGLVQSWILARPHWGGLGAFALAATLAVGTLIHETLRPLTPLEWTLKLAPVWTLALLLGLFLLVDRRHSAWAGLFASAVLFGWVHVGVWPSPLPLTWLAVGLGWLVWRGKSLVGAIALHAMINAVACTLLLSTR